MNSPPVRQIPFKENTSTRMTKRYENYTANELNQYTQRTVPGYLDVLGAATNAATVTVNNQAASRKGDYYRRELAVPNIASAVWQRVTNVAVMASGTNDMVTNAVGNLFLPKTPEVFTYDFLDGNLTSDGRWINFWDGENRLVSVTSLPGAPVNSSNRLTFAYDHQSRRISKAVQSFTNGAWTIVLSNRFAYDGWNLIAELNATNKSVIQSYVWGSDLSGSMQGAGGVGGLLIVNTASAGAHYSAYDGNGNVVALTKASTGTVNASYEYGPFGRAIHADGAVAKINPVQISSKYLDSETGCN